ncbi:nucleoside triphosphate pyrophosphohydrolase [Candidatus Pacearchaeota archaeon]|nr:nucleoside triphosphate pyrophosphohydrolase [Candidatus Pacearchaeota archaeon]
MKYNKLVRDKIPDIINNKGKVPKTHIASPHEYKSKLNEKLLEEVNEYLKSENSEELADILEVIHSIAKSNNLSKADLEEIRQSKANERGSFEKKIILDETD